MFLFILLFRPSNKQNKNQVYPLAENSLLHTSTYTQSTYDDTAKILATEIPHVCDESVLES